MLALHATVPDAPTRYPPMVLVHGAANSAMVWTFWQRELVALGWASYAIDLRGHGGSTPADLSSTSMFDYAEDVRTVSKQLREPYVLMGWSMGGLVAMLAAHQERSAGVRAVVGLAPSTPSKTDGRSSATLRSGEFGPEEYGITSDDPRDQPAMPDLEVDERIIAIASLGRESRYARDERATGVRIDTLPCPLLIATGTADAQWPRAKYDGLHLPAEFIEAQGASHWGLVLSRRTVSALAPRVSDWLVGLLGF